MIKKQEDQSRLELLEKNVKSLQFKGDLLAFFGIILCLVFVYVTYAEINQLYRELAKVNEEMNTFRSTLFSLASLGKQQSERIVAAFKIMREHGWKMPPKP